jgi:sec-independent protein translocase protein TatC
MMTLEFEDTMAISEHIEEFRQRLFFCILILVLATIVCFREIKEIVRFLQAPAVGVKFLQFSPGAYFFASVKIAFFCAILISSPLVVYQFILYLLPGLTKREQPILISVGFGSVILFFSGLAFSYFFLGPAALHFFISYGSEVVEPFWSFDQYFDFFAVLVFSTGLVFQVPAFQFLIGFFGLVTGKEMLSKSKYVVVICTIVSAIVTPSTDPITQLLLALALFGLYLCGSGFLIFFKK